MTIPELAQQKLQELKNRKNRTISNAEGKTVYRRVNITPTNTQILDRNTASQDLGTIAEARQNITNLIEGGLKIEELNFNQKQGILWFLYRYLPYLRSAVSLKTKFMSTSVSLYIPENLKLDSFQKKTILSFHQNILDNLQGSLNTLFEFHNLFGSAYFMCTDNWEFNITKKMNQANITDPLKKIKDKLDESEGVEVGDIFRYFEKFPERAYPYFKTSINILENEEYQKLVTVYGADSDRIPEDTLEKMRKIAFPIMDGLEFFDMIRALNPSNLGGDLAENIDTGFFSLEIPKSDLLTSEPEFDNIVKALQDFHSQFPEDDKSIYGQDEEFKEAFQVLEHILKTETNKLVFKGYSRAWLEAHLMDQETVGKITVDNNSYKPLHVFRIKNESIVEDISNADALIESAIDLLNVEVRQRSHINDTKEKLVTVDLGIASQGLVTPETLDSIVADIADSIISGESSVLSLPEGITLSDHTDIIRASNDTEALSAQAKSNIALFFSMTPGMIEDSEAQFSNTYIKIDTAQNMFSTEREAISKMIEDKVLKPAAVKAGMFCRDDRGDVTIAYPKIRFNRISIGRHSEDYNAMIDLVGKGWLPKDMVYSYYNTSKEELSNKLIEDSLSLDNSEVMASLVTKLQNLIEEGDKEIIAALLKGDIMTLLSKLREPSDIEGRHPGESESEYRERKEDLEDEEVV